MLVALPYFDGGVTGNENEIQDYGLNQLTQYQTHLEIESDVFKHLVQDFVQQTGFLVHMTLCSQECLASCTVSQWILI